ncbi:MAG: peptidylprolyl isomerase [Deltaproteobacteria bacterium]|nr:peptidylprolyl isomerase [Deltaproteobacteria bacterium]
MTECQEIQPRSPIARDEHRPVTSRTFREAARRRSLTLSIMFGLALSACPSAPKDEASAPRAENNTAAGAKADAPQGTAKQHVELPEGNGPVATVNGVAIPRDLFNREYTQTIERYERARHEVKPALRERLKDNIVRRLVDTAIIEQRAATMGITIDPAEQAAKWLEHKKRYGSEDAFKAFLERAGTSEDDVRRQFEANLLREKVFAHVSDEVTLKDGEAKTYYETNKARYVKPEQIRASHILIRVDANATPEVKLERRKIAEKALRAAKAKGADFAAVAKEYGEDPTRDKGGDLGYFARGRMVKAFEDAAWALAIGKISPIVETQFGFHIIKKVAHEKERTLPFAEVREQIERSLLARARNQAIRDALGKWKDEAKIEYFVKGDASIIAAERAEMTQPASTRKIQATPPTGLDPALREKLKTMRINPPPKKDPAPKQESPSASPASSATPSPSAPKP